MNTSFPGRAAALVCFLLGVCTGASLLFLIERRSLAEPVWLALAAAPALAAGAGLDWLICRRAAADRTTWHHTHGGRPGQGRTTDNGTTPRR
ncbi:hypothetical protein ACFV4P_34175 [Kitasatospora sp. NPDC059795]|uniref:hypothetical protein n=1 Tax=Kitasatospora sp. NPDC059795 TaxID=3346949 RepID=UPI003645FE1B